MGVLAMVVAVTGALAQPGPAELGRMQADGAVALSSDRDGIALLQAPHLLPGDSVTGLVALTNTGQQPGALSFQTLDQHDTPGPAGGLLSQVLRLRVENTSGSGAPFEAPLADVGRLELGALAAGESGVYRVTASFPDGGAPAGPTTGDNAQKGSVVSVGFLWRLEAPEIAAATPAAVQPTATQPPPAPAPLVHLRIPPQRAIAPRGVTVFVRCDVACALRFRGQLDTAPLRGGRKTLKAGAVLRAERSEHRLQSNVEQRFYLPLSARALRRLKLQLHRHGRVGITVAASMRSAAGDRDVSRRIVARMDRSATR